MTAQTSPQAAPSARRVRRPTLRDPRLIVGILLVVASVALGSWALGQADRGEPVYAALGPLTPGEPLTMAEVEVVEARVPAGVYLPAAGGLPADAVVTRLVGKGELVPLAAVGTLAEVDARPVGITIEGALSEAVAEGAAVDLWLTPEATGGFGAAEPPPQPVLVAESLRVAAVREAEGLFAGSTGTTVEVLVPEALLPAVLAAVAGDGAITLVPGPGNA